MFFNKNSNILNHYNVKYLLLVIGIFIGLTSFISLKYFLIILFLPLSIIFFSFLVIKPWIGILIYVFIMPFKRFLFFPNLFPFALERPIFFLVILSFFLSLLLNKKYKFINYPFNIILLAFVFIILVSGISAYSSISFLKEFLRYLILMILFFIICNTLKNKKQLNNLIWIIVISAFISAIIYSIENVFGIILGPYINHNTFSISVIMPLTLAFYLLYRPFNFKSKKSIYNKLLILLIILTVVMSILVSQSRGGFIALAILAFFLFLKSKNKKLLFLVFFIFLLLSLPIMGGVLERVSYIPQLTKLENPSIIADSTLSSRIQIQKNSLRIFLENFYIGVGFGNFREIYKKYSYGFIMPHAHNYYLHVILEIGIIGLIIFLILIYFIFKRLHKININNENYNFLKFALISFIVLFIWFIFDFTIKNIYFWILLASIIIIHYLN